VARTIDIIGAIRDPNIIGDVLSPAQEAALRTLYGLEIPKDQEQLVRRCTGHPPRKPCEHREAAFICGRRSGKSDKVAANVALYEAFFRQHKLSPGERGVVLLLAQNMRQAQVVRGYIEGKITKSPILSQHVEGARTHEIDLDNGITIGIYPASFRSIRGLSVVACICDEIAFWWTEEGYANPDVEVLRAVRPSMATFPNAKLVLASSPYAMTGVLWDMWRDRKKDREVLVWHAPTALMNPAVPERFLANEKRRDPENYRREYEGEFTEAVSAFLPALAIEECVVKGRTEVDPEGDWLYRAAIDAAFKGDRFVLAIAHQNDTGTVLVDHLSSWQGTRQEPVRLGAVIPEIGKQLQRYRVGSVYADQYGAEPLRHAFAQAGIGFQEVTFTSQSKADLYNTLRLRILDRRVELLDHKDSLRELRGLEVELLPGGAVRIRHGSSGHDDYADAIALAVREAGLHGRVDTHVYAAGRPSIEEEDWI
jgi:hypothetical protein